MKLIKTLPSAAENFDNVDVTDDSSFFNFDEDEANNDGCAVDGQFCVEVYRLAKKLMDESVGLWSDNAALFEEEQRETNHNIRREAIQAQRRAGRASFQKYKVKSFAIKVESALIDVSLGQGCSASDPCVMDSTSALKACMIKSSNQVHQALDRAVKDILLLLKAA